MISWISRAAGVTLIGVSAAVWLTLVTYKVTDPSRALSGQTANWLGPIGAWIADVMLQMFGLASVILLMGPIAWGLHLALNDPSDRIRLKAMLFLASVMVLAGGFSALPRNANWPLAYGYGGFSGELVLGIATHLVSFITTAGAHFFAGIFLFSFGCWLFAHALGFSARQLGAAWSGAAGSVVSALTKPRTPLLPCWDKRRPSERHRETVAWSSILGNSEPALCNDADEKAAHERIEPGFRQPVQDMAGPADAGAPGVQSPMRSLRPDYDWIAEDSGLDTDHHVSRFAERFSRFVPTGPVTSEHDTVAVRPDAPEPQPVPKSAVSVPPEEAGDDVDLDTLDSDEPLPRIYCPAGRTTTADARGSTSLGGFQRAPRAEEYRPPSLNLLQPAPAKSSPNELTETILRGSSRLLEDTLADFGVKGEIRDIRAGPVVTTFAFEPARGVKSSRVVSLADDIARSMSAPSARISVIPGTNLLGIEIANQHRETVRFRDVVDSNAFRASVGKLPLALGKSIEGDPVIADLSVLPHLLVAGTTGSGKSVGINSMVLSLLFRLSPQECRLLLIDPKMLELSAYNRIPHLLTPVITDPQHALKALNWTVTEMEERYKRMADLGVRNINVYNNRVRNAAKLGERLASSVQTGFDPQTHQAVFETRELEPKTLPRIVIVVDEFADLMSIAGRELEAAILRLAQMSRAAGIHLILATQRPSVDIVTSTIKANFPSRIAFRVASKIDSRAVLGTHGAEQLLGNGDMLFSVGASQMQRVHGAFVSDEDVEAVVDDLRQRGAPQYVAELAPGTAVTKSGATKAHPQVEDADDLFDRAVAVVMRDGQASAKHLQRRLRITHGQASELIERMQREGLITGSAPECHSEFVAAPPAQARGRRRAN